MAATSESLLQSLELEHFPPGYTLHIALFTSLSNASFLQEQLLARNSDFDYAFIDAAVVVSQTHILAAAFRAVNDLIEGRLKSNNVHSEMVFGLSMNNNIATSFRTFGITPSTTDLLVLKLSTPTSPMSASAVQSHLSTHVKGLQVPFDDATLVRFTDWSRVRKAYKLNSGSNGKGKKDVVSSGDGQVDRKEMEMWIVGAMAIRGSS